MIVFFCLTVDAETQFLNRHRRLLQMGAIWLFFACLGFYLIVLVRFLRAICLMDENEPLCIAVSWLWGQGAPLYHNLTAAERYSTVYGPTFYLVDWALLVTLGPTITSAKLTGVTLVLLGLGVLGWTLSRRAPPWLACISLTYCLLAFLLRSEWNTSYGARAEPHLVFWMSVALFSVGLKNPALAAFGCGLLAGMLVDIKMHAILYLLPAVGLLFQRHGPRLVLVATLVGGITALAPFVVFTNISLTNYVTWFKVHARHGFSQEQSRPLLIEAVFIVLPAAAALAYLFASDRQRALAFVKMNGALFLGLALGMPAILVLALRPGAGPHHLLPFVPTLALVLVMTLDESRGSTVSHRWTSRAALSAGLAFPVMAMADEVPRHILSMQQEMKSDARSRSLLAEIEGVRARFPGKTLAVGYGGDASVPDTYVRVNPVLQGNPYLVDLTPLREMQASGLKIPEATVNAVREGRVNLWLIPAGDEPFSVHNFFVLSGAVLFDEPFRKAFRENYSICYNIPHFDVWCFRGKS